MVARGDSCPYKCSYFQGSAKSWQLTRPSKFDVSGPQYEKGVCPLWGCFIRSPSTRVPKLPHLGCVSCFDRVEFGAPRCAGRQLLHLNQMCPRLIPWPPYYLLLGEHRHLLSPSAMAAIAPLHFQLPSHRHLPLHVIMAKCSLQR